MARHDAVVGAGPAGLAAAWRLAAVADVTVYEARDAVGGKLRSDELAGATFDVAVQLIASHHEATLALLRETGTDALLRPAPGIDALQRQGRAREIQYGSVGSMVTSSALPAGLKTRLGFKYLPFLKRHARALDPNDFAAAAAAGLDDESIADWGRRNIDHDFVELLVYPPLAAYYGTTPEHTSAGFFHALAHAGMDIRVHAVAGGMGALARGLRNALTARGVTFRTGIHVDDVISAGSAAEVRWSEGAAHHDNAVIAVPAPAARGFSALDGGPAAWLEAVRAPPTTALALALDRPLPGRWFGLSVPRGEPGGDRVAVVCAQRRKVDGLVPDGQEIAVVYPEPGTARRLAERTPREALDTLLPALEQIVPGIGAHVIEARVYALPAGAPIPYPGYLRHMAAFEPETLPERIALAGDYLVAPTVEGAVRSGLRAADRLADCGAA